MDDFLSGEAARLNGLVDVPPELDVHRQVTCTLRQAALERFDHSEQASRHAGRDGQPRERYLLVAAPAR